MNTISLVDPLLKIVLLIRTDDMFKVDTPLKLDSNLFSSRTHIRNVRSVIFAKGSLSMKESLFRHSVLL